MYPGLSRDPARVGATLLLIILGLAVPATARGQSIIDARRVEFTPSPDHSLNDPDGTALVTRYSLDVFVTGGTTSVATADLGKPAPDPDGMIRVDFVALLDVPLTPGVVYETVVSAVGPGGDAAAPRSNTFSFSLPCAPSISPVSQSIAAAGGTGSIAVSVAAGCAWTASSGASWVTITSGASGTGPGTTGFTAAANTGSAARSGTFTVAGKTFTVNQAGACTYTVSPLSLTVNAAGGGGTLTVTTQAGCAWTTVSSVSWTTITSPSGTGNGTSLWTAAANAGAARTGAITIAGKTVTVSQNGVPTKPRPPVNVRIIR